MVRHGEFYVGSKFLSPVANTIGLPLDQVNFLFCQLLSLVISIPFRELLSPRRVPSSLRHAFELVVGVALTYFCFSYQIWHLVLQALFSYMALLLLSPQWSHRVVFFFSLIYLSIVHIYRQYYDYGGFTLDVTGPLMISTQKLTSFAFSFHDGQLKSEKEMTTWQREQCIKRLPNLLVFFSYIFFFHGIMCGPMCFYADYIAFIDGTSFQKALSHRPSSDLAHNGGSDVGVANSNSAAASLNETREREIYRSLYKSLFIKLLLSLIFGVMAVVTPKYIPYSYIVAEEFKQLSFFQKTAYMLVSISLVRSRYYFAWIFSESVNNMAGLGFSGFDSSGKPRWDLLDNVDIWMVEFSTSLKTNIDGWNKRTGIWLRQVVYERLPSSYNTMAVFCCSAIWHGFYPGYYFTFGTGMLFTTAARMIRRNIRPLFQTSESLKFLYDAMTFSVTRLANVYLAAPFLILEIMPTLRLYLSLYYYLHVGAILAIVYFTFFHKKRRAPAKEN